MEDEEQQTEDEIHQPISPPVASMREEEEDLEDIDGMKVNPENVIGEIGPFTSVKLTIIWQPLYPGSFNSDFVLIFDEEEADNITIQSSGNAIDVPVYLKRETVDMKICMFDRLYQETIHVYNR